MHVLDNSFESISTQEHN